MKTTYLIISILIIFSLSSCIRSSQIESVDRLRWFKDAKFGMFIHWGPYSRLAGEWKGKQVPVGENAEWIMQKLRIPRQTYRDLARKFNPDKFNAKEWVDLAKSTGMKYLVITAKHHDGFAMYQSMVSDYNIVNWTQFNRDPLQELKQECEIAGIKFCIYYSHREDWDEPYAYGNDWDFNFNPEKNLELFEKNYLETKSKPQIKELIKNYGPFGLIWFDRGLYTPEQALDFIQICRQLQPDIIINGRVGNYEQELLGDYQNMSDNGMPIGGIEEYWETPQTINETWGFSRFDTLWKSPREVIRRLAEVVSAGGNYLLNVGPTGEGIIPKASVDILNQVGVWMRKNNKAIYGTTPHPFPKLSWGTCTVKGNRLYLILLNPPESGKIKLPGLNNPIIAAYPVGQGDHKLTVKNNSLDLPKTIQENDVIIVDLYGSPDIDPPVILSQINGHVQFDYISARTFGKTKKRYNRKGKFHISKWQSPQDYVSWKFRLVKPGTYKVLLTYSCQPYSVGKKVHLQSGKNNIDFKLISTGESYDFKTESCGEMTFAPGEHTLSIRPGQTGKDDLFYFKSVELVPVQS